MCSARTGLQARVGERTGRVQIASEFHINGAHLSHSRITDGTMCRSPMKRSREAVLLEQTQLLNCGLLTSLSEVELAPARRGFALIRALTQSHGASPSFRILAGGLWELWRVVAARLAHAASALLLPPLSGAHLSHPSRQEAFNYRDRPPRADRLPRIWPQSSSRYRAGWSAYLGSAIGEFLPAMLTRRYLKRSR